MAAALANGGCTALTSSEEFTELDLRVELERLGPGCGDCMASRCAAFADCAGTAACVDYAACRAENQSPAGFALCGDRREDFQRLLECRECADACRSGQNWDCVANYVWPRVPDPIHFRQRLLDNPTVGTEVGLRDVRVRVCSKADLSCSSGAGRQATTDANGWVELELPNAEDQRGFDGYFLATGETIPTLRIHRTVRLGGGYSRTELFTNESLAEIVRGSTVGQELPPIDLSKPHLVFQVMDCMHQPAVGVSVDVKEQPDAARVILYNDDDRGKGVNFEGTTRLGRGTGAVINLSLDDDATRMRRRLEFSAAGQILGDLTMTIEQGQVTVALLEPSDGP